MTKHLTQGGRNQTSITDVCRQNWQGYQIHKIIGSGRNIEQNKSS